MNFQNFRYIPNGQFSEYILTKIIRNPILKFVNNYGLFLEKT